VCVNCVWFQHILVKRKELGVAYKATLPGVEIRSRPIVRDHYFLGKDDHVLTDYSPPDDLIFILIIVLYEEGQLSFGQDYHVLCEEGPLSFRRDDHAMQKW
jgi:hypothetical protein